MPRTSLVAILALVVSGAAGIACTNSPDDFGGGGSGSSSRKREPREPNAASGDISGDPATPSEETLNGGNADDPADDDTDNTGSDAPDPGAPPPSDPAPDPDPADPDPPADPIPAGSYAVGTQLVTTANLNIRDGADTSYAILATVPNGSTVIVQSVSGANGWVNISWNGTVGWSSKAYLSGP
jgi:uncharacterized protein YgiM (DUF1202 family)